jgi:hypothetical protein
LIFTPKIKKQENPTDVLPEILTDTSSDLGYKDDNPKPKAKKPEFIKIEPLPFIQKPIVEIDEKPEIKEKEKEKELPGNLTETPTEVDIEPKISRIVLDSPKLNPEKLKQTGGSVFNQLFNLLVSKN